VLILILLKEKGPRHKLLLVGNEKRYPFIHFYRLQRYPIMLFRVAWLKVVIRFF